MKNTERHVAMKTVATVMRERHTHDRVWNVSVGWRDITADQDILRMAILFKVFPEQN